ncbi:hypothetical protein [Hyphomonas sp.]|uniref:hypothetical protein n=1 Tax=Hyphomonas sp. TaxID=87 RepID=UPI000C53F7B2|nr:hypothetical protein [Hyphomonas sp.]MAB11624.1 hypothetical protein [Hyphomonas sp.]MAU67034.1 hypothetical protein [Hyphomonas sp.]MBM57220.1 hypothetical protein [Hyphomonas sp.]
MAYDVFLVTVPEDFDMAKLVARRLRSLKFTVRFNQKQTEDDDFDAKDARDAGKSGNMLILWSENSVKNDWVRAAAAVGNSRDGMLVHAGIDKTIPYTPYRKSKRFPLEGFTSRKMPEGFYKLVEELAERTGRSDLRAWMKLGSKDDEARDAWLEAHPDDPLAIAERQKREKALGIKPEPAREAAEAATKAVTTLRNGNGDPAPRSATGVSAAVARASASARTAATTVVEPDQDPVYGNWTIAAICAAIAAIFLFSLVVRSQPVERVSAQTPAIGNAERVVAACPAGTVPRSMVEFMEPGPVDIGMGHGPIIDDTTPPEGE